MAGLCENRDFARAVLLGCVLFFCLTGGSFLQMLAALDGLYMQAGTSDLNLPPAFFFRYVLQIFTVILAAADAVFWVLTVKVDMEENE